MSINAYQNVSRALVLLVVLIVIIVASIYPQSAPIKEDLTFSSVIGVLGGFLIIIALVERATEVVLLIWRKPPYRVLEAEIKALKAEQEEAAAPARKKKLQTDLEKKGKALAAEKAGVQVSAILTSFTLAVITCAAGVGLLESLIDTGETNVHLFRPVDIVLTAALISGGSDSFHQLVRTLETFFKQSTENMGKPRDA